MKYFKHALWGISLVAMVGTTGLAAGCRYRVTRNTHHGNHLLFNPAGLLHFGHLRGAERCTNKMGEGKVKLSFPNGKKRVVGHCQGGLRVGKWKAWYNNGAPVWKARYQAGRIVGKLRLYHPTGRKLAVMTFADGELNGKYKAWWRSGKVRAKGKFAANKRAGCWVTYHASGRKASKGTYADGKKVLSWVYWTAAGTKRKEKLGGEATQGRCLLVF